MAWAALHAFVLNWYGYSWKLSIWDSAVYNLILFAISILVTVTLQYYLPQKNKLLYLAALCSILAAIWLLLSRFILSFILPASMLNESHYALSVPIRLAMGFLIIGCTALLCVLWYTLQEQQAMEKRKTEADRLSRDAELYKLRQQLQPHFLFNSLNSINALIGAQPQKARNMIQQLSDFLRGTLKKEEHAWTSLEEELQHLQLYLDIEKVRFGHRLEATIINETKGMKLPAMLLQPVMENAIKFGLYDTTGDINIRLAATRQNGQLRLEITNPFDPTTSAPRKGTGFGLSSVQRRLYLLFARHDLLQTTTNENLFITTIFIPQPHDQGPDN